MSVKKIPIAPKIDSSREQCTRNEPIVVLCIAKCCPNFPLSWIVAFEYSKTNRSHCFFYIFACISRMFGKRGNFFLNLEMVMKRTPKSNFLLLILKMYILVL